jgi:hypothetical protein
MTFSRRLIVSFWTNLHDCRNAFSRQPFGWQRWLDPATGIRLVCLIVVALLATPSRLTPAEAWSPPLGIPEPSFRIAEAAPPAPDPWGAPTPGFYYVEPSHPSATDSGIGERGLPRGVEIDGEQVHLLQGRPGIGGCGDPAVELPVGDPARVAHAL